MPTPDAYLPSVSLCLNAGAMGRIDLESETLIPALGGCFNDAQPMAFKVRGGVEVDSAGKAAGKGFLGSEETAFTLAATQDQWLAAPQPVANTLGNRGLRSHTELDGHGAYIPVAFVKTHKPMSDTDAEKWSPVDAAPTVTHWPRDRSDGGTDVAVVQPVGSFKPGQSAAARSLGYEAEVAPSLEGGGGGNNKPAIHVAMQVRRLTPVECERLQGFPDGYTNIPWRKGMAPDGPRYKALGNSMAVNCMDWIGRRIAMVDAIGEA